MSRSLLMVLVLAPAAMGQETAKAPTPKEALQAVHDLIGSWRGTGQPSQGTRDEKDKAFWQETIEWQWKFKGKEVWLQADIAKGKHHSKFELRWVPTRSAYELKAWKGEALTTFEGKLTKNQLVVERSDAKAKQDERLVFSLLHANRHLYRLERKPAEQKSFKAVYQVGATKNGVDFASADGRPECVVSGGLGTMPVTHKGETYYVCCSGCRDAFKEEPDKYVREFKASKKK